jgi:hypothetical protein
MAVMGRPKGAQNKDKPWQEALRIAAFAEGPQGKRNLVSIAETCVAAAIAGDMTAIKEIGDRLDGKPAQESTVTIEKRDAPDWSRAELVDIIRHAAASSTGTAKTNGRGELPN